MVNVQYLLSLIDKFESSSINRGYTKYFSRYREIWTKCLSSNNPLFLRDYNIISKVGSNYYECEAFPLEINLFENNHSITFDIDMIQKLIKQNILVHQLVKLTDCFPLLHYTDMSNEISDDFHYFNDPATAVVMCCLDNDCIKTYYAIDGNKRLTAAVKKQIDIDICIILDVIPNIVFDTFNDCLLYNLVSGYYIINGCYPFLNISVYLDRLEALLELHLSGK